MSNIKRHFEEIVDNFEKEIKPMNPIRFSNMEFDVKVMLARYMPEIAPSLVAAFLEYLSAKIALTDEIVTDEAKLTK